MRVGKIKDSNGQLMGLKTKSLHVNKTLFVFQRWLDLDNTLSML